MQSDNVKSKIIYTLHRAKDSNKDQSYFLWTLTQQQLQHCLFPIGAYTKPEVRMIAKKFKLPNWERKDSQGICFTGQFDFGEFLRMQIPKREGAVVSISGEKIGTHDGTAFATIGQRHGVQIQNYPPKADPPSAEKLKVKSGGETKPLYVAGKDVDTNTLVVVPEDNVALYKKEISVRDAHWISGEEPQFPLECFTRIRYRQPVQRAVVSKIQDTKYQIQFSVLQRAVASGQSVVFYKKDGEILGGGVIDDIK